MRTFNLVLKRLIDFFGSLIGIIIISPILLIIAILIKCTSKGPVLFKQERLGKNGKTFRILKFRTMVVNAESIGDGLSIKNESDNRITKAGRILRKTSLDELPQLVNVLLGQMSLVGPRPPVTYLPYDGYVNYPDRAKKRFIMRPGITGHSQVMQRNNTTWEKRIIADIEYIEQFSILFDIRILFATIISIIKSENIYTESQKSEEKFNV